MKILSLKEIEIGDRAFELSMGNLDDDVARLFKGLLHTAREFHTEREMADRYRTEITKLVALVTEKDKSTQALQAELTHTAREYHRLLAAVKGHQTDYNSVECVLACMAEGEGNNPEVYMAMAKGALDRLREALKGSEGE